MSETLGQKLPISVPFSNREVLANKSSFFFWAPTFTPGSCSHFSYTVSSLIHALDNHTSFPPDSGDCTSSTTAQFVHPPAESSAGHTCLTRGELVLKFWIMIDVLTNNNTNDNNDNNNNNDSDN